MTRRFTFAALALALVAGCGGDDGPGTVELYDRAPVPAVPDRTTDVGEFVDDGDYWAELAIASTDGGVLTFDLMQALFAQTCVDELGADECPNDYAVIDEPRLRLITYTDDVVSLTVVNESQQNFAITGDELASLFEGNPPADAAPDDYGYVAFPFLVTVRGGAVIEAHQIWVP